MSIHIHTDTTQDADGLWWITLSLNGTQCGALGPVAVEETADLFAEGIREGIKLAIERARAKGGR